MVTELFQLNDSQIRDLNSNVKNIKDDINMTEAQMIDSYMELNDNINKLQQFKNEIKTNINNTVHTLTSLQLATTDIVIAENKNDMIIQDMVYWLVCILAIVGVFGLAIWTHII